MEFCKQSIILLWRYFKLLLTAFFYDQFSLRMLWRILVPQQEENMILFSDFRQHFQQVIRPSREIISQVDSKVLFKTDTVHLQMNVFFEDGGNFNVEKKIEIVDFFFNHRLVENMRTIIIQYMVHIFLFLS